MATDLNATDSVKLCTNVTTEAIKIGLDHIVFDVDHFCHRDPAALDATNLKPMMDSLVKETLQVPIEVFPDQDDPFKFYLVKGHRRVQAHKLLAEKNTPGFTNTMDLNAIVLMNYTPQDLLVRSISDNEVRLNLDQVGRIRAAKKLHDGGVEQGRAATALGVSTKTYERDLLMAKHGWMLQHLIDGSIAATAALELLETAKAHDRMAEVKEDFDAWVAARKREIRQREQLRKLQGRKELSAAEKQVKRLLPRHLLDHWVELIKQGKRFDDEAEWEFSASLDKENGQLRVGAINLDLAKAPPEDIAKVASRLSQLSKQLVPVVKQRFATKQVEASGQEEIYDYQILADVAPDLAEHLREREEQAKAARDATLPIHDEDEDGDNTGQPQSLPTDKPVGPHDAGSLSKLEGGDLQELK